MEWHNSGLGSIVFSIYRLFGIGLRMDCIVTLACGFQKDITPPPLFTRDKTKVVQCTLIQFNNLYDPR